MKAVAALAAEQLKFRDEVLSQLDRIENEVLYSKSMLQALLQSQWEKCHALINGTSLNGQFEIPSRDILIGVLTNRNVSDYAANCYSKMVGFLDANVKPAKWAGQIIDAGAFPSQAIAASPQLQSSWTAYQAQRINAFNASRDFILAYLTTAENAPALPLARLSQPLTNATSIADFEVIVSNNNIADRFQHFKCDEPDVISPALKDLVCFGLVDNASKPPLKGRWFEILGTPLIGPYSSGVIDTGITLAKIVDFAQSDGANFRFVKGAVVADFDKKGATRELKAAIQEHKGLQLLQKLRWLAEANVLQQSITSGDYTAELIEQALYDKSTKSLNTDPKQMTQIKELALQAMRANPILARNVVLLAMRHAVADTEGTPDKADAILYQQTYYSLALSDLAAARACDGAPQPRKKLSELFPNWTFQYWVSSDTKKNDKAFEKCPAEFQPDINTSPKTRLPARGSGIGVEIAEFYVIVPNPMALSTGVLEQSDSLRLAVRYRDHLNQEIIDRTIGSLITNVAGEGKDAERATTAVALLNEGWGWEHRQKSH